MASGGSSTNLLSSCSKLTDYLRTLPKEVFASLYTHPATCMAVFRWVIIIIIINYVINYVNSDLYPITFPNQRLYIFRISGGS